jgi:hypothetical protein
MLAITTAIKQRRLRLEYVIWRNYKAPNYVVSKTVERERKREGNLRNAVVHRTISN